MSYKLIEIRGMDLNEIFEIKNLLGINNIKFYEINARKLGDLGSQGIHVAPDAIYIKDKKQLATARDLLSKYFEKKKSSNITSKKSQNKQLEFIKDNVLGKQFYFLATIIIILLVGYLIKFFNIYV